MYIFKPSKSLLHTEIRNVAQYIHGKTLDIGAGNYDRYSGLFPNATEYMRMDMKDADIVGSIYEIPFENETFDSLVSTQVFEHLAYPQKGAAEMFRVLKNGGYALVTVPQWNELHEEPHDYFRYTKYGIETLFTDEGFKIITMNQVGGYYSNLAQMRIRFAIDTYNLYQRPIIGRIANELLSLYGRYMIAKDRRNTSAANRKHTIGWCAVMQK